MAVTINYRYPVTGIVAPTALQAKDTVSAAIIATANGDTDVVITHNFGLSVADLAYGWPIVEITSMLQAAGAASGWVCRARATNTVTVTKSGGAGGNANEQVMVTIKRPHSIGL